MSVPVSNTFMGYDRNWDWGVRSEIRKLSDRCHARLIREGQRDYLDGYGFDWSQWIAEVFLSDDITASIEWTHKVTGRKLHLTNIYFDRRTGAINQAGTNYGDLTL